MFVRIRDVVVLAVMLLFLSACGQVPEAPGPDPLAKVAFDLDQLDEDGLVGPADGKRALLGGGRRLEHGAFSLGVGAYGSLPCAARI